MTMIERVEDCGISVRRQCELLQVPRSSHYYRQKAPVVQGQGENDKPSDETIKQRIESVVLEYPRYGYRRVSRQLRKSYPNEAPSNHKRVLRVMRQSGLLCGQKPKAKPYSPASEPSEIPNLLRDEGIVPTAPNQVWHSDLTYVVLGKSFIYLAAILDGFTRKCVGWALSEKANQHLCLDALKMALQQYLPSLNPNVPKLIHHSDQGVQYTADAYMDLLLQNHIRPSLSRRGKPTDNAKAESFFKTLKYEEVYLKEYDSFDDAKANIQHFIEQLYNTKRMHSALGYQSPSEFENQYHLNHGLLAQVVQT